MSGPTTPLEVLLLCQDSMQSHTKLTKTMKTIFNKMGFEAFWAEFEQLIKFPISIYQREPTVERTIAFIANFVTSLSSKQAEDSDDSEMDSNPLLMKVFDFLLQHHNAKDKGVRFRVCQLVNKLLGNLSEEATIDEALYERVFHCMLERLRDRAAAVRVFAALALVRLQDPTDETCPVIKAYIFLMTCDPNPEVRKTIVSHIAASPKTLAAILERTRDVKDTVRQAAFTVIAEKIPVKALSIAQRIGLLEQGLNDRTEGVRNVTGGKLLQSWLVCHQGNALDLLHSLDVEGSTKVCRQMLTTLFKDAPIADLIANFNLLDGSCLVEREKLTCESAIYWLELCRHVQKAGTGYEEHLDMVLPACLPFCLYLDSVVKQLEECQDLDQRLQLEFVVEQLLGLLSIMDLTDTTCRNCVSTLLHRLLLCEAVSHSLVPHLMPGLKALHPQPDMAVNYLAEVIADIRQPITTVEKSVSAEEQRKIDLRVAKVRVELNQAREELEASVENQEFQRAAEHKETVARLEAERTAIMAEAEPATEEVKTEKNDRATVVKCLTIICEMLDNIPITTLGPTLQMLVENQILPGITNEEAVVRNLAVKAIGICCQLKREIIKFHLPVLMQACQMDVESVRVTAIKSLFDLIQIFGPGVFDDSEEVNVDAAAAEAVEGSESDKRKGGDDAEEGEGEEGDKSQTVEEGEEGEEEGGVQAEAGWSKAASNLINILSSFLDREDGELRSVVAEGLCKLLMSRRVFSAAMLSRLVLLWYNPLSEEDPKLRHILGAFFPIFAFTHSSNQTLFEEAFVPTLRTVLNAPTTSPLNAVEPSHVATFLVELTDARRLVSSQENNASVKDNCCHDSIAIKVCNEILSSPKSRHVDLWARILGQLCLSPDNATVLKDLSVLCAQMEKGVTEKASVRALEKFQRWVVETLETLEPEIAEAAGETTALDDTTLDADAVTTPGMAPPKGTGLTANKSTGRRARSKRLNSHLDQSVWQTPSLRDVLEKSGAEDLENVRSNLDSLLLETSVSSPASKTVADPETPKAKGKTRGSKRVLHTIQDPTLE